MRAIADASRTRAVTNPMAQVCVAKRLMVLA